MNFFAFPIQWSSPPATFCQTFFLFSSVIYTPAKTTTAAPIAKKVKFSSYILHELHVNSKLKINECDHSCAVRVHPGLSKFVGCSLFVVMIFCTNMQRMRDSCCITTTAQIWHAGVYRSLHVAIDISSIWSRLFVLAPIFAIQMVFASPEWRLEAGVHLFTAMSICRDRYSSRFQCPAGSISKLKPCME